MSGMSSLIDSFDPTHFCLSANPVYVARVPAAPFAFATNDHFRESFEPAHGRNFWLGIEPPRKQSELGSRKSRVLELASSDGPSTHQGCVCAGFEASVTARKSP